MPRFPSGPFAFGAAMVGLAVLLLAAVVRADVAITLRLVLLAPVLLTLLVGSILTVFSLAAWRWRRRARRDGTESAGFVEAIEQGKGGFCVRVRWRDGLGRELHFTTPHERARPAVAPGARVSVWVCEEDPVRYHFVDLEGGEAGARGLAR